MADSELPVVLQPCNSWKVHCVSDSPAGLGSPGAGRHGCCTDLTGCWASWSHRVGRKQLWGSQQALPPGSSGTTWGSAGCQRDTGGPRHSPTYSPRLLPLSLLLHCLVLTHMLFCVLLLQQHLPQQSQTRCPPGPKAFLYLSEPLNTCSRRAGPDLEGPA